MSTTAAEKSVEEIMIKLSQDSIAQNSSPLIIHVYLTTYVITIQGNGVFKWATHEFSELLKLSHQYDVDLCEAREGCGGACEDETSPPPSLMFVKPHHLSQLSTQSTQPWRKICPRLLAKTTHTQT